MILIQTSECLCSKLSNNILHNLLEASMQGRMWGTQSSINPTSHWHEHNWWWDAAWCCSLYKMLQQQHLYLLSHNIYTSTKKNIFLGKRAVAFNPSNRQLSKILWSICLQSMKTCFSSCCSFYGVKYIIQDFQQTFWKIEITTNTMEDHDNQIQCWYFMFSSCLSVVNTEHWCLIVLQSPGSEDCYINISHITLIHPQWLEQSTTTLPCL